MGKRRGLFPVSSRLISSFQSRHAVYGFGFFHSFSTNPERDFEQSTLKLTNRFISQCGHFSCRLLNVVCIHQAMTSNSNSKSKSSPSKNNLQEGIDTT